MLGTLVRNGAQCRVTLPLLIVIILNLFNIVNFFILHVTEDITVVLTDLELYRLTYILQVGVLAIIAINVAMDTFSESNFVLKLAAQATTRVRPAGSDKISSVSGRDETMARGWFRDPSLLCRPDRRTSDCLLVIDLV